MLANVFAFSSFVQFQAAINAIDPFVVPTMAQATQPLEQLAKSLLRSLPGQLQEQLHDWAIGVCSRLVVID